MTVGESMSSAALDLPAASFISELSKLTLQEMRQKAFERVCELKKEREEIEREMLRWDTIFESSDWMLREREAILRILSDKALGQIPELFRPRPVRLPEKSETNAA